MEEKIWVDRGEKRRGTFTRVSHAVPSHFHLLWVCKHCWILLTGMHSASPCHASGAEPLKGIFISRLGEP